MTKHGWPRAHRRSVGVAGLLIGINSLACNPLDPFRTGFDAMEDAVLYEAKTRHTAPTNPTELKVMTWNIKFAGARLRFFFECNGDRGWMTEQETVSHLQRIAEKINQTAPDLVLLQEVDVDSKRCAYVDNLQYLLNHTDLNYGAYASQWKADYVPSDGIGRIDSGNAILSRWPLKEAMRLALPLIDEQDGLTQYFYLRRNILRARIDIPNPRDFYLLNTHTAAFAKDDTKKEQIDLFRVAMEEVSSWDAQLVAGGDLNAVPPGTQKISDFPDDCDDDRFEGDDFRGQEKWLGELYANFQPAIALFDYQTNNAFHFSFTSDEHVGWTRKLDYLFANENFVPGTGMVHQGENQGGMETLTLSDHAPLTASIWVRQ